MFRGLFDQFLTFVGYNRRPDEKRRLEDDEAITRVSKMRRLENSATAETQMWIAPKSNVKINDGSGSHSNVIRITDWEHNEKENFVNPLRNSHHLFAHHSDSSKCYKLSDSSIGEVKMIGQTKYSNSARKPREAHRVSSVRCVYGTGPRAFFHENNMEPDIQIIHESPKPHSDEEVTVLKKTTAPLLNRVTHIFHRGSAQDTNMLTKGNNSSRTSPSIRRKYTSPQHCQALQPDVQILHSSNRVLNGVGGPYKSQASLLSLDSSGSRCISTLDHERRAENVLKYNEIMRRAAKMEIPKQFPFNSTFNGLKSLEEDVQCLESEKDTITNFRGLPHIVTPVKQNKLNVRVNRNNEVQPSTSAIRHQDDEIKILEERVVPRKTSSDQEKEVMNRLSTVLYELSEKDKMRQSLLAEKRAEAKMLSELNHHARLDRQKKIEKDITHRMQKYLTIIEEDLTDAEQETPALPELSAEMEAEISAALSAPENKPLVEAFNITIKGRDIHTLRPLAWLNDEIINFYMNLLIERGKNDNYPSVYAFNTFFYPKLLSGGFASLKRWTRKVDVFAHDLIVVPVHLGMHWCVALIDMNGKEVCYYDSLGGKNQQCLKALLKYLEDEHMDKKKVKFDVSGWSKEIVADIPQQMNGSDCGMFSCMYAEYLTRRSTISFSQDDMPYFRRKMVYEILHKKLLS